jgi:type IV pilus assembly protein PilY1
MTICLRSIKKRAGIPLAVFMVLQGGWFATAAAAQTPPTLQISDNPSLAVVGGSTPNVLLVMDNSNSMDQTPRGAPVLATNPASKSAIARAAARDIIAGYGSTMNLGLMAYQQSQVQKMHGYKVYSDISFNASNYNTSSPTNPRESVRAQLFSSPTSTAYSSNFYYTDALVQEAYMPPYSYDPKNYYLYWPGSIDPNSWYYILTGRQRSNDQLLNLNGSSVNYACRGPAPNYMPFEWPLGRRVPDNWVNPTANSTSPYKTDWGGFYCQQFIDPDSASHSVKVGKYGRWAAAEYLGGYVWWSEQMTKDASYGFLHVPIRLASSGSQQLTSLNTKLRDESTAYGTDNVTFTSATSGQTYKGISDSNGWRDPSRPLENAGNTPMQGTLQTALKYFTGGLPAGAESAVACAKPDTGECGKNFVVFLTDGMPTVLAGGNPKPAPSTATLNNGVKTALDGLLAKDIKTYFIGFGAEVDTPTLNEFAKRGGTDVAYSAMSAAELKNAMDSIFADIVAQSSSSFAAVATNSSYLNADSVVYQVTYDSSDWSGDLRGFSLNPKTGEPTAQKWSAATEMSAYNFRKIYTYNPTSKRGTDFVWDNVWDINGNLDLNQKSALEATPAGVPALGGQKMLNYIAGATADQGTGANKYRVRATLLGDIVNSAPVYVGKPLKRYPAKIESESLYFDWVDQLNRTPAIYVGANDGMLHAFNADTGKEIFAYIPSTVYGNLPLLASQNYKGGLHKFFVDGSPSVADAFIRTPQDGTKKWRTILVGGLNAGGQGIYALDVTTPNINHNSVLWEFADRETSSDSGKHRLNYDRDLGYTFSAPSIVKTRSGWAAIFGNGYNNTANDGTGTYSTTGNAVLYVVDLESGVLKKKLDTGRGYAHSSDNKPNGLSTPTAAVMGNDGVADYVYAGDLQGNLWKFDLSSSDSAQWNVANSGAPLFTAKSDQGQPQPITVKPEINRHPRGGYMLYFGTGKLFETGDAALLTPINTFYGIWDKGRAVSGRSDLQGQEITKEMGAYAGNWRLVSDYPVDWDSKSGWYLDLWYSSTSGPGERVIGNPMLDRDGRIVFVTVTPTEGECSAGGFSWLMKLDALTGARWGASREKSPFDVNGDGSFNEDDYLMGPDASDLGGGPNGPGKPGGPEKKQPVGGKQFNGFMSVPSTMKGQNDPDDPDTPPDVDCSNTSTGDLECFRTNDGEGIRRVSWRDISTQ